MNDEPSILRKLQLVQLLVLLEFKSICNQYNISYSLIGGSLLGAVRHHGFIPWDDDIDIGMLRSDYNRLIEILPTVLSPEYFMQTYNTDIGFAHPIMRICVNNTLCIEKCDVKNSVMHHGIFIDIFPYDNSPDSYFHIKKHKFLIKILKDANFQHHNVGKPKKPLQKLYSLRLLPFRFWSNEKIQRMLYDEMQRYNNVNTEYVVRTGSQYAYEKVRIQRKMMEETIYMDFEGFPISIMKGYDEHLRLNYGDYMQLPPIDQRSKSTENITQLNLGEYNEIIFIQKKLDKYK